MNSPRAEETAKKGQSCRKMARWLASFWCVGELNEL